MTKPAITFFISFIFCTGFSQSSFKDSSQELIPTWLRHAVIYQIYPQSFKDTDGDGIGDLKGIIQKADYLQSLGVDAVWLNPVYPSPFNDAGYDVTDYCNIAPRYGSLADFKTLIAELKNRNIRVIMDLVAGHTSVEHPWFKESAKAVTNNYSDRYIWTNSLKTKPANFVDGSKYERKANYLKNFFDSQPALNYGYAVTDTANSWETPVTALGPQQTRDALRNVMKFWLDMGVSGFRVDMASSLIKNDHKGKEITSFWKGFRRWMETNYPESVLIAEWGDPSVAINAGFHADFLIHFGKTEYPSLFYNEEGTFKKTNCYFDKRGQGTVTKFVNNYLGHKKLVSDKGYLSVPTANHDFQRLACGPRSGEELKVAMVFFLTWPGLPIIYYGDEIGMRFCSGLPNKEGSLLYEGANRAGSRTPMQWDKTINAGFSNAKAENLYLPIDSSSNRPNVDSEQADPSSLLNFTRLLISLRKSSNALGNDGDMIPLYAEDHKYPFIYQRKKGDESYIVCLNPSGKSVAATFRMAGIKKLKPILNSGVQTDLALNKITIHMEGISYAIYKID